MATVVKLTEVGFLADRDGALAAYHPDSETLEYGPDGVTVGRGEVVVVGGGWCLVPASAAGVDGDGLRYVLVKYVSGIAQQ